MPDCPSWGFQTHCKHDSKVAGRFTVASAILQSLRIAISARSCQIVAGKYWDLSAGKGHWCFLGYETVSVMGGTQPARERLLEVDATSIVPCISFACAKQSTYVRRWLACPLCPTKSRFRSAVESFHTTCLLTANSRVSRGKDATARSVLLVCLLVACACHEASLEFLENCDKYHPPLQPFGSLGRCVNMRTTGVALCLPTFPTLTIATFVCAEAASAALPLLLRILLTLGMGCQ